MTDSRAQRPNGHRPPPAAADPPEGEAHEHGELRCVELCPICRAADILRTTASPELRDQWQTVQREALLTTKVLIEQYLDRLDAEPADERPHVEDIEIL